ncbi:hypothetical protein SORBI_3002G005500 [Sorghum bicolor]|uniref:Dirigent protein n=1 Tax=Sorghum bicolor TaxID=4558 RepID=A0A1W0W1M8_SORBI|nr:hypothetical protein SORBI_3002G005500 [Sorghum bicolor]
MAVVVPAGHCCRCATARPSAGGNNNGTQHLHLFMHDGYPTAVLIVNGSTAAPVLPGNRRRHAGDGRRADGSEGPSRASRPVGHARPAPAALLLSMNLVLADDGSTVAVMGRNDLTAPVRELSVVGGTGRFRMATGYVLWKMASWRADNAAVLELDVFLRA